MFHMKDLFKNQKLYLDMVLSGEKVNIVSSVKEIELTLKENKEGK